MLLSQYFGRGKEGASPAATSGQTAQNVCAQSNPQLPLGEEMGLSTFPGSTYPLRQLGITALHLDLCISGTARGADSHHQGTPPAPTVPGALSDPPAG